MIDDEQKETIGLYTFLTQYLFFPLRTLSLTNSLLPKQSKWLLIKLSQPLLFLKH